MNQIETQKQTKDEVAYFEIKDMLAIAVVLVVVGITIAFGLNVLADVRGDFTAGSAEYNATSDTISGISKLSGKMPIIGLVVVAAIIIGILVRYFMQRAA